MRRKFSLLMTLSAWLLATGSHWDLVQTFAWGRMIAAYSQSMSLGDAIKKTFTAENLCGVCEVVNDAKQGQDATGAGAGKLNHKVQLAYATNPVVIMVAPEASPWLIVDVIPPSVVATAPPTPPPRVA
ncbi:hypothetical protein MASR2M8_05390 [Opitutaceae bacterium]